MRIIIKVGTNLLTGRDGTLNTARVRSLAGEILALKKDGCQVVLVSSGAIGAGMGRMGLSKRPDELRAKQALAAIGQPLLMHAYETVFAKLGITVAQVLLTRQDFDDRQRYINARNTMLALLEYGAVPIINENDTVAVDEIKIGENDTLSALVAAKIGADHLIIFTDVDGLYKGVPGISEMIPVVERITPEIEACASGVSGSGKGVGGMKTKLAAAKIATTAGVKMTIANGGVPGALRRIVAGEQVGTLFVPRKHLDARKCWIAFGARCRGRILIDSGAVAPLVQKGKSLLPSGIVSVEGRFKPGDTVSVIAPDKREVARGLTYFSAEDIDRIKGKKTAEMRKIIPGAGYEEVIHRDNLVIL